jgi:hypothetical protein
LPGLQWGLQRPRRPDRVVRFREPGNLPDRFGNLADRGAEHNRDPHPRPERRLSHCVDLAMSTLYASRN